MLSDRRSVAAERGAAGQVSTAPPETVAPPPTPGSPDAAGTVEGTGLAEVPLATGLLADLDHPHLVLSDGYVGPDRRAPGRLARLRRATFAQRRSLLTLEAAVVAAVVVAVTGLVVTAPGARAHGTAQRSAGPTVRASRGQAPTAPPVSGSPTTPLVPATLGAPPGAAAAPASTTTTTTATTVPPAPPAPAVAGPLTPTQLGAEALTMVRYPWQQLPGYSIQFLPIADAPSPGFYGNTTFTWGHTGGTSVLYVYPGETATQLAGIIGFEIAHEVDAAAVEPGGGESQIENILNYHPASWAPDCDCAEQGFLSGWYAAAFSNYWSPGVGNWSQLPVAPPSGATLGEVAAWLNPPIP